MAESQTLARPYAEAVYGLAREQGSVDAWSGQLSELVSITTESQVAELINNPSAPTNVVAGVVNSVGSSVLTDDAKRLVDTMAASRRLSVVAEVKSQFEALRADDEGRIHASVTSAVAMTADQQTAIKKALDAKWSANVEITYSVDAALIGGAVIKARDWVIDGSVASQLNKLAAVIAQ
ncbi:MAG: F0F1 ATP synthase subunit delta [Proteobacteria bacterium]|nr:F0F1 ATP synthase subunit delta [Pseudomonadota bacterium]